MDDGGLSAAFERSERALDRIERVLAGRQQPAGGDAELRARVRQAVAELDELIRQAGG